MLSLPDRVRFRVDGDRLLADCERPLTDLERAYIKANKAAIVNVLLRLQALAGPEWGEISADAETLRAFVEMLEISAMRERGEVPTHYTARTECVRCGPVPVWEGCPSQVQGCPWCFNRRLGRAMPVGTRSISK